MGKNMSAKTCIICEENLAYYGAEICNKCIFKMDEEYHVKQWRDEMQRQMVEMEESE